MGWVVIGEQGMRQGPCLPLLLHEETGDDPCEELCVEDPGGAHLGAHYESRDQILMRTHLHQGI